MEKGKRIEINAAIFPVLVEIHIGDKKIRNVENNETPGIGNVVASISLPRGAYLLYLQSLKIGQNDLEIKLLEQYTYGIQFSEQDYNDIIGLTFTSVQRNNQITDFFERMGVGTTTSPDGEIAFVLKDEAIPEVKASTWDCILIDLLHDRAFDIINCFDFEAKFERKHANSGNEDGLQISLGAYNFTADIAEKKLSSSLRAAFMFTVVPFLVERRNLDCIFSLDYVCSRNDKTAFESSYDLHHLFHLHFQYQLYHIMVICSFIVSNFVD